MKKNYIQPKITSSVRYEMESLCSASIKVAGQWGNKMTTDYNNGAWFNEGHPGDIIMAGGDDGLIDSQTKERGGDWGSIW